MSKKQASAGLVIECSPQGFTVADRGNTQFYAVGTSIPYAGQECIVAIGRGSIFIRPVRVPNASEDDIRSILITRATQLFPIEGMDLAYDFQLTDDVNESGRLVIMAGMASNEVTAVTDQVKASGIKVRQVIPAAFGSSLIARDHHIPSAVVVEKTAYSTSVDVVIDGTVRYSRAAGFGSLTDEVQRTLAAAGFGDLPVIATGGTDYPGSALQLSTTTLQALSAASLSSLKLNIETPLVVATRNAAKLARSVRQAAMLTVAALITVGYTLYEYSNQLNAVNAEIEKAKKKQSTMTKYQKSVEAKSATKVQMLGMVKRAFTPAQPPQDIISVVMDLVPKDSWLTGVTFERGKQLVIRGTSKSNEAVSSYMRSLTEQPRFRDVKLSFSQNGVIANVPVVQFTITAFPVGNLPLIDNSKKGVSKKA